MAVSHTDDFYEDLDLGDPESLGKEPQSPQRQVDTKEYEKPNAPVSAKLIQSWTTCQLKGNLMLADEANKLRPSGYGRDVQRDGTEYEKKLIQHKNLIEKLIKTHLEEHVPPDKPIPISIMEENTDDHLAQYQTHFDHIEENSLPEQPHLFYQVCIYKPAPHPEYGIIDLLLWTGEEYMVGEVKLTSAVKEQTAFQLRFYHEFLSQNRKLKLSQKSFILHCRHGWIYNRKQSAKHCKQCIENTELLPFDLDLKLEAYLRLFQEITQAEKETYPGAKVLCANAKLVAACWECQYRNHCHQTFFAQAENPLVETAGFGDSELDVFKSLEIKTCQEALEALPQLQEIHEEHEDLINSLRRRLEKTIELGGYSEWNPPPNKAGKTFPNTKILFYSQISVKEEGKLTPDGKPSYKKVVKWSLGPNGPISSEIPEEGEIRTIVAFTAYEFRQAKEAWKDRPKEKKLDRPSSILLENEITKRVWFPFPSLTLEGITSCLKGINTYGNWAKYYQSPEYKQNFNDKPINLEERHQHLIDLYLSLEAIHNRIHS